VERNRVKRLLREAFAQEAQRLGPGTDLVVVARPGAKELAERESLAGIRRALAELIDRVASPAVESRSPDWDRASTDDLGEVAR
jgi:ribonuclease P protein component